MHKLSYKDVLSNYVLLFLVEAEGGAEKVHAPERRTDLGPEPTTRPREKQRTFVCFRSRRDNLPAAQSVHIRQACFHSR